MVRISRLLSIALLLCFFSSTLVFAAPPPWILDPFSNPNPRPGANIAGDGVVTISNPPVGPCGMVRYVYPSAFTWDQLGDITFTLDVDSIGGGQGIFANLYMDIGKPGPLAYGWHNGRLDYTYPITPGLRTYSTAGLISNPISGAIGNLTLAAAKALHPNAEVSVYLHFGGTTREGCGLVARFVDSSLGRVGGGAAGATGAPIVYFTDGRLNPHLQAPAIVYCFPYGIQVYAVQWLDRAQGLISLNATTEMIEAVPALPTENTLIAENGTTRLYRLTSGEFQVNHGPYRDLAKPLETASEHSYEFRWRDCSMFPSVRKIWDINTGATTLLELIGEQ